MKFIIRLLPALLIFFSSGGDATYYNLGPRMLAGDPCDEPSPPIGVTCSGGQLYGGTTPGGDEVAITPGGCTGGSSCTGGVDTVTLKWYGTTGGSGQATGELIGAATTKSTIPGHTNTAAINAYFGPTVTDSAAKFCANLTFGGYNDWYLPSKSELAYIYCHSTNSGSHGSGKPEEDGDCATYGLATNLPGFQTGTYWTSSEASTAQAWGMAAGGNGQQGATTKGFLGYVRCIRVL